MVPKVLHRTRSGISYVLRTYGEHYFWSPMTVPNMMWAHTIDFPPHFLY